MATIKDVASMAGVSTATVSRVINQTAWVEPVTRERVEKAMRDLNYRRNAAAIALAKRSGDIMRILHQRGVQLPQQLSIVGFDDVVLARYLYPALTTMHYPVEQMARCAAQLAIQLYQGITPPPSSNHFNAELVIRDSVAPYFSR
ncbi:LacI family DNA-binding transcriptional regulator [Salmonella enterica]|nr:LacI family DNA-binding transcriptional regulator [Salmonella enterica]